MDTKEQPHKYSELVEILGKESETILKRFSFEAQQVVEDIRKNSKDFSEEKWSDICKKAKSRGDIKTALFDCQNTPTWVLQKFASDHINIYQREYILRNDNSPEKLLNSVLTHYSGSDYLHFFDNNRAGMALCNLMAREIVDDLIENNYRVMPPYRLAGLEQCNDNDLITRFLDNVPDFKYINEQVLTAIINNRNLSDENRVRAFEIGFVPNDIIRLPESIKQTEVDAQIEYYENSEREFLQPTAITSFLNGLLVNDELSSETIWTLFYRTFLNKESNFYRQYQVFPVENVSKISDIKVLYKINDNYDKLDGIVQRAFLQNPHLDEVIKNTVLLNITCSDQMFDFEHKFLVDFIQNETLWDNAYDSFIKRAKSVLERSYNDSSPIDVFTNEIENLLIHIALSPHTPDKYLDKILENFDGGFALPVSLATLQKIARHYNNANISNYIEIYAGTFYDSSVSKYCFDNSDIEKMKIALPDIYELIQNIDKEINGETTLDFVKKVNSLKVNEQSKIPEFITFPVLDTMNAILKELISVRNAFTCMTFDELVENISTQIFDKSSFYDFVVNIDKYQKQYEDIKNIHTEILNLREKCSVKVMTKEEMEKSNAEIVNFEER